MKRVVGVVCISAMATTLLALFVLLVPSPAVQAAPQCIKCPLYPLPDECPPCTQWVGQTCRKCAHCERIPGCQT